MKSRVFSVLVRTFFSAQFILSLTCCSPQNAVLKVTPELTPEPYIHTISYPGETLGIISYWYTGSTEHWKEIAEANSLLDPRKLSLGAVVLIPRRLLRTDSPLPRKFVERVRPKPATKLYRKPPTSPASIKSETAPVVDDSNDDDDSTENPAPEPTPDDSKMDAVLRSLLTEPATTPQ